MKRKLLLLILAVIIFFACDSAIESGVKKYLVSHIQGHIGLPVQVEKLHLDWFKGRIRVENLAIHNPPGFREPLLVNVEAFNVTLSDVLSDHIRVPYMKVGKVNLFLHKENKRINLLKAKELLVAHRDNLPTSGDQSRIKISIDKIEVPGIAVTLTDKDLPVAKVKVLHEVPAFTIGSIGTSKEGVSFKQAWTTLSAVFATHAKTLQSEFIRHVVGETFKRSLSSSIQLPKIITKGVVNGAAKTLKAPLNALKKAKDKLVPSGKE